MDKKRNHHLKEILEKQKKVSLEIKEKTLGYILAALGFVVGLAWNDAIKSFIEYLFPFNKNNVIIKFLYAFLITSFLVAITFFLAKKTEEEKETLNK